MSIENEMKVNSILKVRLNDLPKEKSKIVSIFLSSTFTGLNIYSQKLTDFR